jgi:hypothetical protein
MSSCVRVTIAGLLRGAYCPTPRVLAHGERTRRCRSALRPGWRRPSFWRVVRRPVGCARSLIRGRSTAPTASAAECGSASSGVRPGGVRACLSCMCPFQHLCHIVWGSDEGPPVAVLLIEMDTASWYRWFASPEARRTSHPLPGNPGHHLDHGRGADQGCCWEPQTWMTARGIRSGSSGN